MPDRTDRWTGRPVLGALVSVSTVALPLLATLAVAAVARNDFPAPRSVGLFFLWLAGQLALSALTYAGVSRLTLRLLPLAALLKMTLVFPDRAPSRFAVARRAGSVRNLDARVEHVRGRLATGTPGEAAVLIIELVGALGQHDRRTRGHSERVRAFTDLVADELELPATTRNRLRWSALLHDIGKLTVHTDILNKPGKPDHHEWEEIKKHPLEGAKLVAPLVPWLGEWSKTIEQHHEKYDGSGYPFGLAASEISYGGRIVAVTDAFEVMTAKRSYKDAISPQAARAELTRCAGSHFDPDVVRAFLNVSIGRLRWTMGPAALVAQLPVIGELPFVAGRATGALSVVSSSAAAGAFSLGAAGLMGTVGLQVAAETTASSPAVVTSVVAPAETGSIVSSPDQSSAPPSTTAETTRSPIASPTSIVPSPTVSGTTPTTRAGTPTTVVSTTAPALPVSTTWPTVTLPSTTMPTVTVPTLPTTTAPTTTAPTTTVPPTTAPTTTVPPAPGLLTKLTQGVLHLLGRG